MADIKVEVERWPLGHTTQMSFTWREEDFTCFLRANPHLRLEAGSDPWHALYLLNCFMAWLAGGSSTTAAVVPVEVEDVTTAAALEQATKACMSASTRSGPG